MVDGQRFSFLPVRNTLGEMALRPQVPLTLGYQKQSCDAIGLLDTGADVNVLPYHLGVALGAVWSDQQIAVELSGNLANQEARGIIISATIGQLEPVDLAFAWTRNDTVPLLLGQVNFFMAFDVCFYRAQRFFVIANRG
jgi:hypothetical protein